MDRIIGFDPIIHEGDQVLILGSMPSVESLKQQMYYANKTNRFWKILGSIYSVETESHQQKLRVLEIGHIALWDICHSCVRKNSADATIREVIQNDIPDLLDKNPTIQKIICNGKTSYQKLCQYYPQLIEMTCVCPSTSAANAKYRLDNLIQEYERILKYE